MFLYGYFGADKRLGTTHDPTAWHLFIDSSKVSLKAVLLHNGNQNPSVPVKYCGMQETYENMGKILAAIKYDA